MGAESDRLSNTLMMPLFSATKTRPSGENRTAVGLFNPLSTTSSTKPRGNVPCATAGTCSPAKVQMTTTAHAVARALKNGFIGPPSHRSIPQLGYRPGGATPERQTTLICVGICTPRPASAPAAAGRLY